MVKRYSWLLVAMLAFVTACKKDNGNGGPTADDKLKDDILTKTREHYLWNDQIPQNFDARSYAGPEEIMGAISEYSMEPGFSEPVDHFSFAMKKAEWDKIAAGVTTDFGLNVFFMSDGDLRVRAVEKESPAGLAGVRRGWRITKIDGSTNITSANSDFIIDKVYSSPNTTFTFQLPDGSTKDLGLTAATYQEQPLYLDTIYTEGAKKAGYLVFNSFLGRINDVTASFGPLFSKFVTNGVTDVIVDLRYNGGGYVSLQQTLANYLVKGAADGDIMMNEEFNALNAKNNVTEMFRKLGGLNINNIYFIVSENTASASELLINNLKPYMNVKLVGEKTYGKPVGFFDIQVGDWLIFPVSFRSTNGQGQGNYFDGIPVDQQTVDGLDKDWGDVNEASLGSVLTHIRTGAFSYVPQGPGLNSTLESDTKAVNNKLNKNKFKGAVIDK
jgi:carboxyl-terminal processing protease